MIVIQFSSFAMKNDSQSYQSFVDEKSERKDVLYGKIDSIKELAGSSLQELFKSCKEEEFKENTSPTMQGIFAESTEKEWTKSSLYPKKEVKKDQTVYTHFTQLAPSYQDPYQVLPSDQEVSLKIKKKKCCSHCTVF